MTEIGPCIWVDTITVTTTTCTFIKFVTEKVFDNPPDYGTCTSQDNTCSVARSGDICVVGPGDTALGKIELTPGDYEFRLDEANLTYEITLIE